MPPHGILAMFLKVKGNMLTCDFHYVKSDVRSGEPLNKLTEKLRRISLEKVSSDLIIHL